MAPVEMNRLFGGIYSGKKILITGNTGFKGSWLAYWLHRMGGQVYGYSISVPTNPSHFRLLNTDHPTVFGDILDTENLKKIVTEFRPEIVFHMAAQSLVRESYVNPLLTYQTNCIGTLNVLQASRSVDSVRALVNITTDKVYEYRETVNGYTENDPLGGHDPYSSSKACAEILTASFRKSFLMDSGYLLASVRAGNVIGGGDWANDRLIPDLVTAAFENKETAIRYPDSIRPWQHVLEPLSGYLLLGQRLLEGERKFSCAWNFGPSLEDSCTVREVLNKSVKEWPAIRWKEDPAEKLYESPALLLNSGAASMKLHWKPVWNLQAAIQRTISWYRSFYEKGVVLTSDDLEAYISQAKSQQFVWCQ
ncbi:MAG TPA: CDP-glucose 4,6-dehydratase [Bacteroidia bacterium]|nr:CDP-glucose 4,6-dehydratase [Bacteroidia bacterium]